MTIQPTTPASAVQQPPYVIVPSIVGPGQADLGLLSLGRLGRSGREQQPLAVDWGQGAYLVGAGTERYTRPLERMNLERLAEGADTRALTYAALGQLLGPGSHQVHLLVGFPVQVMADRQQAKTLLRGLRRWLKGTHTFTLDGQTTTLDVLRIQALAQPVGAFFAWGLDNAGHWARPAADIRSLVGVLDIGFNTLDLFAVQDGQVIGQYTGGDTAGVRRATEILRQEVQRAYDVTLSQHQADALLHARRPVLDTAAGSIDLQGTVSQALEHAGLGIQSFVETRWGRGRQFRYVLVTGGGAPLFRRWILELLPSAHILPQPVTANALGLARYARRVWPQAKVVGLDPGFGGFKAVALEQAG